MTNMLWAFLLFLVTQRLLELIIAKRNERWMKERGGIERGGEHYKYFILLHCLFFLSLLMETSLLDGYIPPFHEVLFLIFLITQIARIWCMQTLGKFWNTRIIVLPDFPIVKRGPYRFINHPNYIIVGIELFVIPLIFGAVLTSIIFPLFHIMLVRFIRIPIEERALQEFMSNIEKEDSY